VRKGLTVSQVTGPLALALDWDFFSPSTPKLRPLLPPAHRVYQHGAAAAPPTTLQAMLDAYVEEEQLTGANQWRLVISALS
jgi:hypothetical protein